MVTGEGVDKPVRLGDVATVEQEEAKADSLTRTDGKPSLAVAVTMDHDGSAVAISERRRGQASRAARATSARAPSSPSSATRARRSPRPSTA